MALIFKLLFVLLLCYTLCVPVHFSAAEGLNVGVANEFKPIEIKPLQGSTGSDVSGGITIKDINLPLLFVAVKGGVIVAITNAKYTKNGNVGNQQNEIDVVTRYFEPKDENKWEKDVFRNVNTEWITQLATENDGGESAFSAIMASTVNTERNKIYIFLLRIYSSHNDPIQWRVKLVEGTVKKEKDKLITWNAEEWTTLQINEERKQKLLEKTPGFSLVDGSVFSTGHNKIEFLVRGKYNKGDLDKKDLIEVTVFFQFEKIKQQLKLLHVESFTGEYSFFQWEQKIFKAPTNDPNCKDKKVMVFNEIKKVFEESHSPVANLQTLFIDKKNFFTTTIEGKDVLLFTQIRNADEKNNKNVHLWMTDGTRVTHLGPIVKNVENFIYGSLLYTGNKLFALNQKDKKSDENQCSFFQLKEQLENIKSTLRIWNAHNGKFEKLCKESLATTVLCSADGLVGLLFDTNENNEWTDKYNYAKATVTIGEQTEKEMIKKVGNGFTFSGAGAGAKWPVAKAKEEQPYNFADPGFTLVATVKIEKNNKETFDNSLLGLILKEDNKHIGLWCSSGKWAVGDKNKISNKNEEKCEQEKTYILGLVLEKNKNLAVYVDGNKLKDLDDKAVKIGQSQNITHFYFGAVSEKTDGKQDESFVTITNVFLYNRPLTEEEFNKLKQKATTTDMGENTGQNKEKETNRQSHSLPPTTEDSAVRVGVVGVLCFMLFGVFTLLGRYVY